MKKTILIFTAIILVAGLAFFMGRQSAPAPVAENPPTESSTPEVKETPEPELNTETEATPEPTLVTSVATPADIGGVPKSIFESLCEKTFTIVWSSERLLNTEEEHLQTELGRLSGYLQDIGRTATDVHNTAYQEWRTENHPAPKPMFLFIETEADLFFTSEVTAIYDIPCLAHATAKEINQQLFHNKKASSAMISEGGTWVRFKYNGEYYYLPAELCSSESAAAANDVESVIPNMSAPTNQYDYQENTNAQGNPGPSDKPDMSGAGSDNTGKPTKIPNDQDDHIQDQYDQSKTPIPEGYYPEWTEGIVDAMGYQVITENETKYVLDTNSGIKHKVLYMTANGGYYIGRTEHTGANATYYPVEWVWMGPITNGSTGEVIVEANYSMQGGIVSGGNSDLPLDNSHLIEH